MTSNKNTSRTPRAGQVHHGVQFAVPDLLFGRVGGDAGQDAGILAELQPAVCFLSQARALAVAVVQFRVGVVQADEDTEHSRPLELSDRVIEEKLAVGEDGANAAVLVNGGNQVVDLLVQQRLAAGEDHAGGAEIQGLVDDALQFLEGEGAVLPPGFRLVIDCRAMEAIALAVVSNRHGDDMRRASGHGEIGGRSGSLAGLQHVLHDQFDAPPGRGRAERRGEQRKGLVAAIRIRQRLPADVIVVLDPAVIGHRLADRASLPGFQVGGH